MIELDFTSIEDKIRSNIGDPEKIYVSDSTITSALIATGSDEVKATILIMEAMLSYFSVQADECKTGDVEYKYNKLFERFKSRLQEYKTETASTKKVPIIIGGVSITERNNNVNDSDAFLPILQDQWNDLHFHQELIDEDEV